MTRPIILMFIITLFINSPAHTQEYSDKEVEDTSEIKSIIKGMEDVREYWEILKLLEDNSIPEIISMIAGKGDDLEAYIAKIVLIAANKNKLQYKIIEDTPHNIWFFVGGGGGFFAPYRIVASAISFNVDVWLKKKYKLTLNYAYELLGSLYTDFSILQYRPYSLFRLGGEYPILYSEEKQWRKITIDRFVYEYGGTYNKYVVLSQERPYIVRKTIGIRVGYDKYSNTLGNREKGFNIVSNAMYIGIGYNFIYNLKLLYPKEKKYNYDYQNTSISFDLVASSKYRQQWDEVNPTSFDFDYGLLKMSLPEPFINLGCRGILKSTRRISRNIPSFGLHIEAGTSPVNYIYVGFFVGFSWIVDNI